MSLTTVQTISSKDEANVSTNLVFNMVTTTPTVEPYPTKVSLTIGAKVYTFDTADLLLLARNIAGT